MKILLVEDDLLLGAALRRILETRYAIDLASNGQAGLDLATAVEYDLILLDVQIPKLDGISLCRQLRAQGYRKPILLLTADDSDAMAIAGFDAGADDCISKPCAPEVLLARLKTLLRRSGAPIPQNPNPEADSTLRWGTLCLDSNSGRVTLGEQAIVLTATEYNLLELFLQNPNRIFSRSAILDRLWGFDDAPTDRAVVTHVKDVRKKLKAGGLNEDLIETIYGMGYRLKPAPQSSASPPAIPENTRTRKQPSAIDEVLERFRSVFDQQVAVLEQASTSLLAKNLEPELQQAAQQEAHKLAGSLASFGYPNGSMLARSLEHLLISGLSTPENIIRFSKLVTELRQELTKTPASSAVASTATATTKTRAVLVIDDDTALTERLKAESAAWGFLLNIAPNPAIARSILSSTPPNAILLDLSFPEAQEDGLSLLQEIAGRSPDLPVVVFTGRGSLVDRLAASRLGARQFLHKPVTTKQIFQTITRVLSKPQVPRARVLIVDDDPGVLAILSSMLTPWGLEVATLSEPQHFWNVLVATSPSLILLDLEMPQVDGLELCQVVRQDAEWGDLPILVVTAHTDAEALQQAFAAGADDFITKPVLGPELITRVLSRIERTQRQKHDNRSQRRYEP